MAFVHRRESGAPPGTVGSVFSPVPVYPSPPLATGGVFIPPPALASHAALLAAAAMRARQMVVAVAVATATAAATAAAAVSHPPAAAAAAAAASAGAAVYSLARPLSSSTLLASTTQRSSSVCITQQDLHRMTAATADGMAAIGVPPPLVKRWVYTVTVQMPAELGLAEGPPEPATVQTVDKARDGDGRGGGGGDGAAAAAAADKDGDKDEDDPPTPGTIGEASPSDDRRCYVSDDAVEYIVSSFDTVLDEAGVAGARLPTRDDTAGGAAPAPVVRAGGVCLSCCALSSFKDRFHEILRICACRRCHCNWDCR